MNSALTLKRVWRCFTAKFGHHRNPLQCSCLQNPRDGRALGAAVYGVTQSRTGLKWLSSPVSRYTIIIIIWFSCSFFCPLCFHSLNFESCSSLPNFLSTFSTPNNLVFKTFSLSSCFYIHMYFLKLLALRYFIF